MRELFDSVTGRLDYCAGDVERQLDALAYLGAQALYGHPLRPSHGRAVSGMVAEAMRRLDFPVLELGVAQHARYGAAPREWAQHRSLALLCEFRRDVRLASLDDQDRGACLRHSVEPGEQGRRP